MGTHSRNTAALINLKLTNVDKKVFTIMDLVQSLLKQSIEKVETSQLNITSSEFKTEKKPVTSKRKGKNPVEKEKVKREKSNKKEKNESSEPKKRKSKTKKGDKKIISSKDEPAEPEPTWNLSKDKLVRIRKFQGKVYVDIREYFMDKLSWEILPGKKGVSLSLDQYRNLKSILPQLDSAVFANPEEGAVDLLA